MKAHLRQARLSPKKTNLVASLIRGMTVDHALALLERLPKKGARMLHGVISSAIANAEHNDNQERDLLYIKTLIVNKGPAFRRSVPMARGRSRPIDKWTSHISVELGVTVPVGEVASSDGTRRAGKQERSEKKEKSQELVVPAEKVETVDVKAQSVSKKPPTPSFDIGADPHSKSTGMAKGGSTFQPHHKGGRGS